MRKEEILKWDAWNVTARADRLPPTSQRQAQFIECWLARLDRRDLDIIDVGCGTGWMSARLARFGHVTGTDAAEGAIGGAAAHHPQLRFIAGDLFELDLSRGAFDVVVSLEVLSHVVDQAAFVARLAELLRPGGWLLLATQNRRVYRRWSAVEPNPGWTRHWVDAPELRRLLAPHFELLELVSVVPAGDQGALRLVNSPKLNRVAAMLVSQARIDAWKERMLLGSSLIAVAQRRDAMA